MFFVFFKTKKLGIIRVFLIQFSKKKNHTYLNYYQKQFSKSGAKIDLKEKPKFKTYSACNFQVQRWIGGGRSEAKKLKGYIMHSIGKHKENKKIKNKKG